MKTELNKLLFVLDMSEDEQYAKLAYYVQPKPWKHISSGSFTLSSCDPEYCRKCKKPLRTFEDDASECPIPNGLSESLADLAFRLRDEAVAKNHADFHEGIYDVMVKVEGNDNWATAFWGECLAKPIHWVIASLIAKGKLNENRS